MTLNISQPDGRKEHFVGGWQSTAVGDPRGSLQMCRYQRVLVAIQMTATTTVYYAIQGGSNFWVCGQNC